MTNSVGIQSVGSLNQSVRHPKAEGYNIRIGQTWLRTVVAEGGPRLGTRDSLAPRTDDSGSIYDNVLDIGYAWGRTDLSGGEGLDWDPREIALNQNAAALDILRFYDSNGIDTRRPDTAGGQYSIRLGRASVVWGGTVVDPRDMTTSDSFVFIADGVDVSWYDSWTNLVPIGSAALPAGVIAIAAAPNGTVMATCEDGNAYIMPNADGTFVIAYTDNQQAKYAAQGVWYVNGRFMLSAWDNLSSSQLWEISFDGTSWEPTDGAEIDTASSPFYSVVESGPAIVAACGDGTVRTYTPTTDDPDLVLLPRSRFTVPEGETPIMLGANAGVLLIFTTSDRLEADREELRIYQAEVLDARFNFVVGQLQLKREWLGSEHEPLVTRNMANTRDDIYFFVKEERKGILYESLWRFDVVTGGMNRVSATEDVNFNGIIIFNNKTAGIDFANANITLGDDTQHQIFGYMIFPNITFGLNTDISWLTTIVEAHGLQDQGAQIELWRSTDPTGILDPFHPSWVLIQRISSPGGTSIEIPLVATKSRTISLQLRMAAGNALSESPKVTRIAIRGIPAHRDFIMQIPINISDYVSVPHRKPTRVPGLGYALHTAMLDIVGNNVEVAMIDPPVLFRGIINNISEPIEYLSNRGSVTRYCMVEFRGQRLGATETASGDAGMGLGLLGIATLGIGQTELE
jgi:hypothetical protein